MAKVSALLLHLGKVDKVAAVVQAVVHGHARGLKNLLPMIPITDHGNDLRWQRTTHFANMRSTTQGEVQGMTQTACSYGPPQAKHISSRRG